MPATLSHLPRTAARLRLQGRVDAHVVADVNAQIDQFTDTDVDLDLTDVRFLDGAVLNSLAAQQRRLRHRGHDLRIAAASTAATVILELAVAAGVIEGSGMQPAMGLAAGVAA